MRYWESALIAASLLTLSHTAEAFFVQADDALTPTGPLVGVTATSDSTILPGLVMSSSADLATGRLKSFTDSALPQFTYFAFSSFGDGIHFNGLPAVDTPITLLMTVHGSSSGVMVGGNIGRAELRVSGPIGSPIAAADVSAVGGGVSIVDEGTSGILTILSQTLSNITFTLADTVIVSSLTPDIEFSAFLSAEPANSGGDEVISDFGHTGALSISLPPGVTFTSDSGVLLSEATPIPEPASASLMAATIAIFGLTRRRRRCELNHGDQRYPQPQRG